MSTLETNNISKYNGSNISFNDPLQFKTYTTTQINDLSGMAAGDTVYDSDLGTIKVYNGSTWNAMSGSTFSLTVDYLVIAGGGSGAPQHGGGGGAGGYRSSYNNEASGGGGSSESSITVTPGVGYVVTVGAGGAAVTGSGSTTVDFGNAGSSSVFSSISTVGGGKAASWENHDGQSGGSGGGASTGRSGGAGTANQGYAGGDAVGVSGSIYTSGGGGGAGAVGVDGTTSKAGNGGAGVASTITGSSVTRAGGGGGGMYRGGNDAANSMIGAGGAGGGGDGSVTNSQNEFNAEEAGTANTGGGGGGHGSYNKASGAGGSGVVILRYTNTRTISNAGGGLVFSTTTDGDDKVTTFTAGTGSITWS